MLEARAGGDVAACFDGYSVGLGCFTAGAMGRAQHLRVGLPLASFMGGRRKIDKEIDLLVRRLAGRGFLEYRLSRSPNDEDLAVIEPQIPDYWPRAPRLADADAVVLSRFAYMRRRGDEMVLESPRSGALFRICDPAIAAALASLSKPRQIKECRQSGFPTVELLALLLDCQILFKIAAADYGGLRPAEGDDNLVLWDFHDLLFHARSTQGRHANPLGGVFPHAGAIPPLPAVRPCWPGKKIDLCKFSDVPSAAPSPFAKLLRQRHSTRSFDDARPITVAQLARFLDGTGRIVSRSAGRIGLGDTGPLVEYAGRPYPSAGGEYELELYLAVDRCEGLARGFYHYDAGRHALVPIDAGMHEFEALLMGARFAMAAPAAPQVLITMAARFGRVSWKYSSIAYALMLKDVGVLLQTFYLMATEMGLGGCAIGIADIDLFAKLTGIAFHIEGPVGQFALGRAVTVATSD